MPWTTDATSGIACPANASEWSDFVTASGLSIGAPSHLYNCQEASGNLADAIGSLTLTTSASPSYQQAVSGWSRLAVKGTGLTNGQGFYASSGGPNPSTTSIVRLMYIQPITFDASAGSLLFNGSGQSDIGVSAYNAGDQVMRLRGPGGLKDTTPGAARAPYAAAGAVFPILMVFDVAASSFRMYTDREVLKPTYGAASSGSYYAIGAEGKWNAACLYDVCWESTAAETFTAEQAYKTLAALGWTLINQDGTSAKKAPWNLFEWEAVKHTLSGCSFVEPPSIVWNMQETSGSLADSVGTFVGSASGTGFTYQSTVTGWSRKGVLTADAATAKFTNTDAGLPDLSASSCMMLSYVKFNSAPGTYRNVQAMGTTTQVQGYVKNAPELQIFAAGNSSTLSGIDPTGQVRPFVLQHNQTANLQRWLTNQEILVPNGGATPAGKTVEICGGANGAADAANLYTAVFFGTAGELTTAQLSTLLQALGWTIPWGTIEGVGGAAGTSTAAAVGTTTGGATEARAVSTAGTSTASATSSTIVPSGLLIEAAIDFEYVVSVETTVEGGGAFDV